MNSSYFVANIKILEILIYVSFIFLSFLVCLYDGFSGKRRNKELLGFSVKNFLILYYLHMLVLQ
jgi:hypothetical protein